jgi:hypothetical protein
MVMSLRLSTVETRLVCVRALARAMSYCDISFSFRPEKISTDLLSSISMTIWPPVAFENKGLVRSVGRN